MKKFSFARWSNAITNVFSRFPSLVFITFLEVLAGIFYVKNGNRYSELETFYYVKTILICNISLVFGLTMDVLAEKLSWNNQLKWISRIGVIFVGILLYFLLNPGIYKTDFIRIALLIAGTHFLISSLPVMRNTSIEVFWEYNKQLFLGILQSLVFSTVLYIGIALSAGSLDLLFGINVYGKFYGYLACIVYFGFNTIMFLSTIPKLNELSQQTFVYSKGLKVFAGYILLPLIGLYSLILLMYELRIISLGEFPRGYIAYMVLAFAICGLLSYLLLYPIRNNEKWIRIFYRIYFIIMIPILVLMWISVGIRIKEYGITELRYILAAMTIWLSGIALFFTLKKSPNIKWVSFSLAVLALAITFGPMSASFVSKKSQTKEIENMLTGTDTIYTEDLYSKLSYLSENFGVSSLQKWVSVPDSLQNKQIFYYYGRYDFVQHTVDTLLASHSNVKEGNRYYDSYARTAEAASYIYVSVKNREVKQLYGAKYMLNFRSYQDTLTFQGQFYEVKLEEDGNFIFKISDTDFSENKSAWLQAIYKKARQEYATSYLDILFPQDELCFSVNNNQFKVCFETLSFSKDSESADATISNYAINLFVY